MEKTENIENLARITPKTTIKRIFNIKTGFLAGLIIGSILTYHNHDRLVEFNNLKHYKITENGALNPYHTSIEREIVNDTVFVYVTDRKANKTYQLHKDLRLGDFEHRLNSLIGDEKDKESIVGKYGQIKENTQEKMKKAYETITEFFKEKMKK